MNQQQLENWAHRAVLDLAAYADAAIESGSHVSAVTTSLLAEFEAIKNNQPTWQSQLMQNQSSQATS